MKIGAGNDALFVGGILHNLQAHNIVKVHSLCAVCAQCDCSLCTVWLQSARSLRAFRVQSVHSLCAACALRHTVHPQQQCCHQQQTTSQQLHWTDLPCRQMSIEHKTQQNSTYRITDYPDQLGPSGKFVENSTKSSCLEIIGYRIKYSTVLWLLELQIRRGRKV